MLTGWYRPGGGLGLGHRAAQRLQHLLQGVRHLSHQGNQISAGQHFKFLTELYHFWKIKIEDILEMGHELNVLHTISL